MRQLIGAPVLSVIILATLHGCERRPSYRVPGGGMEPNIVVGQSVELHEKAYSTAADVRRGDVVVLRFPQDESRLFVKRVVGLPGETVSVVDGRVSINGTSLSLTATEDDIFVENADEKSYRVRLTPPCLPEPIELKLEPDVFFVLGDNRCASLDSRDFGPVAFEGIRGAVILDE